MRLRVSLFLFFLPLLAPLAAQETRGAIVGHVLDATGSAIAGAQVRATNTQTGVTVAARSNESGNYALPYLMTGTYTLQGEAAGFKKSVREGIELRINDRVEVNLQLQIGDTREMVEVREETPLLDTAASSLGQVVDQRRVIDLPTFGGSVMVLVQLAPGVINSTDMRLAKSGSFSINKNSQFATDGAGNYNNEFTLDGVSNTQAEGGSTRVGFIPPAAAVGEFKVQTAAFDAGAGHTVGSVINVSTKSGTNQLRGEAHWALRNSAFDAPNIFQNRTGQKLPHYTDNRWGIVAGGPVLIPGAYNGKNRTFWFYGYQENRFGVPQTFLSTVPTEAMRRGDLSALLAINGTYQVYDPATTVAAPAGRFQRQPFAGNIIPTSRLDPVAQKIITYWPSPNQTGLRDGGQNYFHTPSALESTWDHLGRIDHAFSSNHRAFLRFHTDFWEENKNHTFPNTPAVGIILNRHNRGFAFDDVYVINPAFLFNFRYGLESGDFVERRNSRGFDLSTLGFSSQLVGLINKNLATFPNVQVGNLTQLGNWESGDGGTASLTHALSGTFTKLVGNHNIRFGTDFRVYRQNLGRFQLDTAPQLAFSSIYTRGPLDNSTAPTVGGELTAFLLGVPAGELDRSASYAQQDKWFGVFLHDDWKITRRMTLNLGLRYEYESPVTERFNRSVAHFAFDQASPIAAQAIANYSANPIAELPAGQFKVPGGLTYVNVGQNPRTYWNTDKRDFMPRIGFAYQWTTKTTVRGGYGVFFDTVGVNKTAGLQTGFSQATPIQASLNNGLTYVATTANPFPAGLLAPRGADGGLSTNLGQAVTFYPEKRTRAYIQRWSMGMQRELPGQFLMEATYVGNRGTRLGINHQLNNTPARYLSTSPVRDTTTINFLSQTFPNPFLGTNPIYGTTISRANLLRPYPQFSGVSVEEPVGYTWYHALQFRTERRFSKGYTFQLSYTWSKTMQATEFLNPTDNGPYRTISDLDRMHHLVATGIWELPFGRGRAFAGGMPKALNFFAGGWQLNGVVQRQSGAPLGFGDVWTLFTGDSSKLVLPTSQRSVDRWFNTDAGFNKNTAQQLASSIRVSPLRFGGVRGNGQSRWDFSAIKSFYVNEKVYFQFRAECLNALNHPNLFAPNTTVTSSAFGSSTNQDVPRSWQLSLTLKF
ncbi:MAG: carboxypeptidase regulatory-like domain-containing protein [Candidatus Solibacter usitatus]|nr:carboxypeptidase regulatory-like domain-containing protein [Candidatus Solibacter usitatus]